MNKLQKQLLDLLQERKRSEGRVANNLEQDRALERLNQKLSHPDTLAVFKRLKDR